MNQQEIKFNITSYDSIQELKQEDAELLKEARNSTKNAYAPYSNFRVGAFARLVNGKNVSGTNQENAAFPAGICAERTLLSAAASLFPNIGIDTMAISYHNLNGDSDRPVSPCGICRQSLFEFQQRTGHPIRIILSGMTGPVYIISNAQDLLPLVFSSGDMKKS
ncbi:MAG TPA: cytidine deaminase [Chitinophagaceae bacterium]|nr:cytidine deaminase [Chitinophagaceae bacterium]